MRYLLALEVRGENGAFRLAPAQTGHKEETNMAPADLLVFYQNKDNCSSFECYRGGHWKYGIYERWWSDFKIEIDY